MTGVEHLCVAGSESKHTQAELRNDDVPAAFWDALPDNEENADLLAVRALQEETSPSERAETLKVQANDLYKRGLETRKKYFWQQAVSVYTEAVLVLSDKKAEESALKSIILSNRAQAHLKLGNLRNAIDDAKAALLSDEANAKTLRGIRHGMKSSDILSSASVQAAFRGASAAAKLGDFERAAGFCRCGLRGAPGDEDLGALSRDIEERRTAAQRERAKASAKQLAERAPAKRLAQTLLRRGWKIAAPQISVGNRKPYVDEAGVVHWPVVFVYTEVSVEDCVEDVGEGDTLEETLDLMFGPGTPKLEWDTAGDYTRRRLELYYLSNAAAPLDLGQLTEALHSGWPAGAADGGPQLYGEAAARAVRVSEHDTLGDVLRRPDCVVPGVPLFLVVAHGTAHRDRFLERLRA